MKGNRSPTRPASPLDILGDLSTQSRLLATGPEGRVYYFARTFGEDNREGTPPGTVLAFDTRIWRIAEAFEHARVLYQNLGVNPSERIHFQVRHTGLAGRTLIASEPGRYLRPWRQNAATREVVWTGEATLDQIATELRELVRRVCDELFLMFGFFQLADTVLDDLLSRYLSSRI